MTTLKSHADLIGFLIIAVCAWLLGNNVTTLGVWSAGHDHLNVGSALFFLSHNHAHHAYENITSGASYVFLIYVMRRFWGLSGDKFFIIAALIGSHVVTLATYIWIMPYSEIGSHGLSVATSALLGLVLIFFVSQIAERRQPNDVLSLSIMWACIFAAAFFAVSAHRHGFQAEALFTERRGEIGHAIGFGFGLICGVAHAASRVRTRARRLTA